MILEVIKWNLTLGQEPQTFLGAKWIEKILELIPESKKRLWALRFVSMSPHYFITEIPEYRKMSNEQVLESSFKSVRQSRIDICNKLLNKHLQISDVILDYGCGPGFIANIVSENVKKVYAVDISAGAIACAKILNGAENIEYLRADKEGLRAISDELVDVVYSFAVAQHLKDEVLNEILKNCHQKLKQGGKLLLHIQMTNEIWLTQQDFAKDTSIKGKLKYQYDLHCFGRSEEKYLEIVGSQGFENFSLEEFKGFDAKYDEELKTQRLLIAYKKG